MINLKFTIGGQDISASADSPEEAISLLGSLTKTRITAVQATPVKKAPRASHRAQRTYKRWTMDEARTIVANADKSAKELAFMPVFAGRSRKSIDLVRGYVRKGVGADYAPRVVKQALAETGGARTGLLD